MGAQGHSCPVREEIKATRPNMDDTGQQCTALGSPAEAVGHPFLKPVFVLPAQ